MTCGNCPVYGTVWFDHDAKKWKHGVDGGCTKPEPRMLPLDKRRTK